MFKQTIKVLSNALNSVDESAFMRLANDCEATLRRGNKIIASGLGKNVPICDKFVGSMLSLGLNAGFMHTNTAVHGDLGMVHDGDLVIVLTKSGSTTESVYLVDLLKLRKVKSDDRFEWYSCILFSSAYLLFCLLRIRQFWDILSMKRRVFLCG